MLSICIPLSNDNYFLKKKKIIFHALEDLFENLSINKIKSQIVIVDFGGKFCENFKLRLKTKFGGNVKNQDFGKI